MLPKVTVLMPVYNGEEYVGQAIESILSQTFNDFEFLIINDASTDNTLKILQSYKDPRIKIVTNEKNLNVEGSLNRGLELATGEYIARMDHDDISLPNRLQTQVDFMDTHPEVGICSCWIHLFGAVDYDIQNPVGHTEIKCEMIFNNVIAHPGVIMRKSLMVKYNLKYELYRYAEDRDLWIRCSFLFELHNIPQVLLNYRISSTSVSQAHTKIQNESVNRIIKKNLELLNISADDSLIDLHKKIGYKTPLENPNEVERAGKYLVDLLSANNKKEIYPKNTFKKMILKFWYSTCDLAQIRRSEKLSLFIKYNIKMRNFVDASSIKFTAKHSIKGLKRLISL